MEDLSLDMSLRAKCANCGTTFLRVVVESGKCDQLFQACPFCRYVNPLTLATAAEVEKDEPAESSPRDLKFLAAVPYPELSIEFTHSIRSFEIKEPFYAFVSNVRRLHSMLELPVQAMFLGGQMQAMHLQAKFEVTGKFNPEISCDEEDDKIWASCQNLMRSANAMSDDEHSRQYQIFGRDALNAYSPYGGSRMWMGLESVLIGQVTGAWTAFEVLAGDLWESSLNGHPQKLANLTGRKFKGHAPTSIRSSDEDKTIPLSRLAAHRFEVAHKMGTLLKNKFNFTNLVSIREAYWRAFNDDEVGAAVDSPHFAVLSALRNVFVHRAGIADKEFLKHVSQSDMFSNIAEGQRIPLDGEMVHNVVGPAIAASVELTKKVSAWLSIHRETSTLTRDTRHG